MEKEARKALAELIRKSRLKKRRLVDGLDAAKRKNRDKRWLLIAVFVPLALSIALAIAARQQGHQDGTLRAMSVALMLWVYVATIYFGAAPLWRARRKVAAFAREPAALANAVVRSTLIVDSWLLNELAKFTVSDLEEMALALDASGQTLAARVHLLTGAIEKIGILPGILALLIAAVQLPRGTPDWVSAFMFAMPIIYLLALVVTASKIDVDHYANVVRLALARKRGPANY